MGYPGYILLNFRSNLVTRCYDVDSLKHLVMTRRSATGIQEAASEFELRMYPNPAANYVVINAEAVIEKAEITDLCGQQVGQQNFFDKSVVLNLDNLAAGTYLVQLTTADNRRKTVRVLHL